MLLILLLLLLTPTFGLKIITTSYGTLRGITDYTNGNDERYIFKGIPFAKPPLGNLRFALPRKPDSWKDVLDASKYSAACMSNSTWTSTPQKYISEDCLYINIFTSEKCLTNKCPVIVYYHGGSFNLDSATMFPDKFILERYVDNGIVFVIPAYRLGVFGQFYLGDPNVVPTNLLIHDSIEALRYVHYEIANFGGNPNDVTLMGHSSGGQLVNAIGFSSHIDPERKLFQKLIVLSSHEMLGFEVLKQNNSFEIARKFDCYSKSLYEIVECMRKVDALEIIRVQEIMEEEEGHLFKSLLPAPPLMDFNQKLADFKNNAPARKMLCGVTEHEFEGFHYKNDDVNGNFLDFENPVEIMKRYHKDYAYTKPYLLNRDSSSVLVSAATYSEALVNAGGEVHLFETRQKPNSMHVTDMQYFIGIHREEEHTKDMDILDSIYSQLLVNFTKYGDPSPYWEKLDLTKMNFLVMEVDNAQGIVPHMENDFHEELYNFWLIDMMELDMNITSEKQHNVFTTRKPLPAKPPQISISPNANESLSTDTTTLITELVTEESYPIYNQWWFYAIIIFIVIVATIVILICLNKSSAERQPLLL